MPRVSRYLERNLQHPALARLKTWFDRHLPASAREGQEMSDIGDSAMVLAAGYGLRMRPLTDSRAEAA